MADTNLENPVCGYCSEPFLPEEKHVACSYPTHRECLMRMVIGSLGHQMKQCSCYGGSMGDPPELTLREAAIHALEYWEEMGGLV